MTEEENNLRSQALEEAARWVEATSNDFAGVPLRETLAREIRELKDKLPNGGVVLD